MGAADFARHSELRPLDLRPGAWRPDTCDLQISNDGGKDPIWSHDGKELFYTQSTQLMSVRFDTSGELRADVTRKLFEGRFIWQRPGNIDVSVFGTELRVVLNWFQEFQRLAPL